MIGLGALNLGNSQIRCEVLAEGVSWMSLMFILSVGFPPFQEDEVS